MEKQWMGLNALRPGERGILREILMPARPRRVWRSWDCCLKRNSAACIVRRICRLAAYAVGGAVFALRKKDAAQIVVEAVR